MLLAVQGAGGNGKTGYEDTTQRGLLDNQMGDNLPVVNLGTNYVAADFIVTQHSTCTLSTANEVKCFGKNDNGQLGYGDTTSRGGTTGSMGDALPVVDIGSGWSGNGMRLATSSDGDPEHTCILEESDQLLLKCWGDNSFGQLGYGYNGGNRGGAANQMGDDLPFIDTKFTFIPQPTSVPTLTPSVSPTDPICDESEMYGVIWHDLVCYILYIVYLSLYMFLLKVRENTRSLRELSH